MWKALLVRLLWLRDIWDFISEWKPGIVSFSVMRLLYLSHPPLSYAQLSILQLSPSQARTHARTHLLLSYTFFNVCLSLYLFIPLKWKQQLFMLHGLLLFIWESSRSTTTLTIACRLQFPFHFVHRQERLNAQTGRHLILWRISIVLAHVHLTYRPSISNPSI